MWSRPFPPIMVTMATRAQELPAADAQAQEQAGEGHSALKRSLHKVKLQNLLFPNPSRFNLEPS